MSEKHQIIHRIYKAFGRRDLAGVLAEMHKDAHIDFTKSLGPESGVYPGAEGVKKLLDLYWEAFEDISHLRRGLRRCTRRGRRTRGGARTRAR